MVYKLSSLIVVFVFSCSVFTAQADDLGSFFTTSAGMDASVQVAGSYDGKSEKSKKKNKKKNKDKYKKRNKNKSSDKSNKSEKSAKSDKSSKSDKSVKSDKSNKSGKSKKSDKSKKSKKSDKQPPVRTTEVCLLDTGTGVYNLTTIPVSELEEYMAQNLIGPLLVRYRDADGDILGDPNVSIETCSEISGYVSNAEDLDDTEADYTIE